MARFTLTRTGVVSGEGCVSFEATDGTAKSESLQYSACCLVLLTSFVMHVSLYISPSGQAALTTASPVLGAVLRQTRERPNAMVYSF